MTGGPKYGQSPMCTDRAAAGHLALQQTLASQCAGDAPLVLLGDGSGWCFVLFMRLSWAASPLAVLDKPSWEGSSCSSRGQQQRKLPPCCCFCCLPAKPVNQRPTFVVAAYSAPVLCNCFCKPASILPVLLAPKSRTFCWSAAAPGNRLRLSDDSMHNTTTVTKPAAHLAYSVHPTLRAKREQQAAAGGGTPLHPATKQRRTTGCFTTVTATTPRVAPA